MSDFASTTQPTKLIDFRLAGLKVCKVATFQAFLYAILAQQLNASSRSASNPLASLKIYLLDTADVRNVSYLSYKVNPNLCAKANVTSPA